MTCSISEKKKKKEEMRNKKKERKKQTKKQRNKERNKERKKERNKETKKQRNKETKKERNKERKKQRKKNITWRIEPEPAMALIYKSWHKYSAGVAHYKASFSFSAVILSHCQRYFILVNKEPVRVCTCFNIPALSTEYYTITEDDTRAVIGQYLLIIIPVNHMENVVII